MDETTFKKYKKLRDPELGPLMAKSLARSRSGSSAANYGRIKMEKNGRCPFLTGDDLCHIQLRMGEEYLSDTCYTYPRTVNEVNGVLEKSATMSCPEVVRLALYDPAVMEFDLLEEPAGTRGQIKSRVRNSHPSFAGRPERFFWGSGSLPLTFCRTAATAWRSGWFFSGCL